MLEKHKKRVWLLIIVVAAICALVLVGALSIRSTSKGEIAGLLNLGSKYLTELDYEQAVVSYLAVIEIDPKCEEAYMGIAEAYLQMGEYDKAMEYAMQGYSQTGDESLFQKAEMIQALADMAAQGGETPGSSVDVPENAGSQDVSEEEAAYGECIVDGIYHHGYARYEITEEDENFFNTLIAYTEAERYEECAELLKDWQCRDFVHRFQHLNNSGATVHMAYKGYKIGINTFGTVWLIPIEDGVGVLYHFSESTAPLGSAPSNSWDEVEFIEYTYCECTDGMYNGSFVSHVVTRIQKYDHVAEEITEGEVVNGLINGQVTTHYDNPPYEIVNGYPSYYGGDSGTGSYYSIFSLGKVQKVEYETAEDYDGASRVWAWIRFNEDGTPRTEGVVLSQEDVENAVGVITAQGCGYGSYSPIEREDGSYEVYPY